MSICLWYHELSDEMWASLQNRSYLHMYIQLQAFIEFYLHLNIQTKTCIIHSTMPSLSYIKIFTYNMHTGWAMYVSWIERADKTGSLLEVYITFV